jgi:hypothetical protein
VEQLLILLLFLALPRIIKTIAKQGKSEDAKKRPARQQPRRAPAPTPEDSPTESEVQLPPWLESLAERLGGPESKSEPEEARPPKPFGEPDPEAPPPWHDVAHEPRFEREGATNYEAHPLPPATSGSTQPIASTSIAPAPGRRRAVETLREMAERRSRGAAGPAARSSLARPRGPRPVMSLPRGRQGWRRAIVLAEILGAPRALRPYDGPNPSR